MWSVEDEIRSLTASQRKKDALLSGGTAAETLVSFARRQQAVAVLSVVFIVSFGLS